MSYGPASGLLRGRSELTTILPGFINGQQVPIKAGVRYPLTPFAFSPRGRVMQVNAYCGDILDGGPRVDAVTGCTITLRDQFGVFICENLPLSSLLPVEPALLLLPAILPVRQKRWEPFHLDPLKSYITDVAGLTSLPMIVEFVYLPE